MPLSIANRRIYTHQYRQHGVKKTRAAPISKVRLAEPSRAEATAKQLMGQPVLAVTEGAA
jgi:hypothetical protein